MAEVALRNIREKLRQYIENRDATVGCLQESVQHAFSSLRQAIADLSTMGSIEKNVAQLMYASDAAENACRQRMLEFFNQHISELQNVLCRGEDLTQHKAIAHAKSKEFHDLKIAEIDLSSIGMSKDTTDFGNEKSISGGQRKDFVRSLSSGPNHTRKSPQRVEQSLASQVLKSSRSLLRSRSPDLSFLPKRPATSLAGLSSTLLATTFSHVAPVDAWPSQKLRSKAPSPFCGESEFPNRGFTAGPIGSARDAIFKKVESIGCDNIVDSTLPERVEAYKPKELVLIERFIDSEFTRRKCSLDTFNEARYEIFRQGFARVIRTFKSWSALLLMIQTEYDGYVSKLQKDAEQRAFLEAHARQLQKDYETKFGLLRTEADKTLEGERMHSTARITVLSQDLHKALSSKAGLEDILTIEKSKVASLTDQLEEAQRQQSLLLKGYADQIRDLNRMMDATGMTSINDVVRRFKEMVHVHTVWEMEARLQVPALSGSESARGIFQ